MSTSEGLRIKLKKRLKPVVTRRRIDSNDDIEPITYRRNRGNSNSNVKYKDGELSNKMDAINHGNPRVYKEKQFHSDFDRKQTNSYKKDDRERGRPFSHTGPDDFVKEKKSERTPRRKYPIRGSENSGMFEEKSYGFRAVGDRIKFRNKNVDGKMPGTRDRNEGEDGFTYRRFNSNRRMDTRNDNVARNSDAKTRHNDESFANRSIKMPRQKKGSDEESVITDEKYNRSGVASVNLRLKKKKLDGSVSSTRYMDGNRDEFTKKNSSTRYMDGSRDEFTKKNSNGKFNSNIKTDQRETGNRLFTRNSDVQNKHLAGSLVSSGKKTLRWKKGSESDDGSTEVLPKKRKRIIRIDPHDISNKRIDDSISSQVVTKAVENIEVSQNAQFRAIKPSSEILSFVEDNLLGRRRLIEFRRAGYNIDISAPLDNIPLSTSSERERMEENVFGNKLEFFAAAKVSSSLPPPDLPEIAFAGRSNVGKSSLLNSLTRQWGVVRTSDKPGLTQSINFFNLASKLCLVDLPGYGFAYAKEEVKDAWEELVKEYVSTRAGLKRVCLLIDTKWGMKPRDYELINLMEGSETQYQIVLTKTDLVFPIDVARRAMQIQETLKKNKSAVKPVMMVSSKTGAGIRSLRTVLAKVARFAKL